MGALECDTCWEVRKAAAWSITHQNARTRYAVMALYLAGKVDPHYMVRDAAKSALDILIALAVHPGDGQAGARRIVTVPGRGYCFVAPIEPLVDGGHRQDLQPTRSRPTTCVGSVYAKFTAGFETRDLKAAKALLAALGGWEKSVH